MKKSTLEYLAKQDSELVGVISDLAGKSIQVVKCGNITNVNVNGAANIMGIDSYNGRLGNDILEIAIESDSATGALTRVFVGIVGHGIVLQSIKSGERHDSAHVWVNCYTHGDCGKNWSSGGTWSSSENYVYFTARNAFKNRGMEYEIFSGMAKFQRFINWELVGKEIDDMIKL